MDTNYILPILSIGAVLIGIFVMISAIYYFHYHQEPIPKGSRFRNPVTGDVVEITDRYELMPHDSDHSKYQVVYGMRSYAVDRERLNGWDRVS